MFGESLKSASFVTIYFKQGCS